jgi:hypothetical protein
MGNQLQEKNGTQQEDTEKDKQKDMDKDAVMLETSRTLPFYE